MSCNHIITKLKEADESQQLAKVKKSSQRRSSLTQEELNELTKTLPKLYDLLKQNKVLHQLPYPPEVLGEPEVSLDRILSIVAATPPRDPKISAPPLLWMRSQAKAESPTSTVPATAAFDLEKGEPNLDPCCCKIF